MIKILNLLFLIIPVLIAKKNEKMQAINTVLEPVKMHDMINTSGKLEYIIFKILFFEINTRIKDAKLAK